MLTASLCLFRDFRLSFTRPHEFKLANCWQTVHTIDRHFVSCRRAVVPSRLLDTCTSVLAAMAA